ncbi:uncharacterized protein ISCGN_015545 [Ixodes scapularis]
MTLPCQGRTPYTTLLSNRAIRCREDLPTPGIVTLQYATQLQCASLVDLYGPYLLDAIGNIGNSHEICKFVDMCSDGTEQSKLLGAKQCTEGSSYWCGTPEQAASCNAQEYCKKKVWKQ